MADFRTELPDSPGTRHALHHPSSDQVAAEAPISCPYCHTSTEAVWMAFYNPLAVTNLVWQLDRPGWNRERPEMRMGYCPPSGARGHVAACGHQDRRHHEDKETS